MSQELNIQRVMTVSEAQNFQLQFGSIIADALCAAPAELISAVKKCSRKKRGRSKLLLAPSELKVIQTDYEHHMAMAKHQECDQVTQLKVAAISTLVRSQENLQVSEPVAVTKMLSHIVKAETVQEVEQDIKAVFKEIKALHTQSFVTNITHAIKESAVSVGFQKISVQEPCAGLVRVVATNQTGQNLIAEVETAKQVDIRTELVGYTDGSCEKVMRAFDNELSRHGITTKYKEQKPTYGIPQLPYAKKLRKLTTIQRRSFEDEVIPTENECRSSLKIKQ